MQSDLPTGALKSQVLSGIMLIKEFHCSNNCHFSDDATADRMPVVGVLCPQVMM